MTVKIHYYAACGRANMTRLALAAGGIPFEDVFSASFPPSEESYALYKKLTGGNETFVLPMMTVGEDTDEPTKVYTQSVAIARQAGRMGGLAMKPTDESVDAEYLTDKLLADAEDIRKESYKAWKMMGASAAASEKFAKTVLGKHIKNLEAQLVALGGDYFGGSSVLSIADVCLYDAIVFFGTKMIEDVEGIEDPCGEALKAWIERVESNEGIKKYLASEQFAAIQMKPSKAMIGL